ncbi:hypothetical protein BLA29_005979 [Euroglyphus maynei]|uniref:Uncharacterized protein n=1 Tax=Euroglyphus maynei TaxID=6958 RepID=A0A1Y3AUT5_EURMA|nr:hypothetical protein BLA29_005979 [Euroglyphus maynei]
MKNGEQQSSSSSSANNNKQIPLHLLLKKELTKNNSFQKRVEQQQQIDPISNIPITEYPTLKLGDAPSAESQLPMPSPPPPPLPPSLAPQPSAISKVAVEIPPRIDRNSKPSRFRSAHERLFGSTNGSFKWSAPPAPPLPPTTNNISNGHNHYQTDDSDYINTTVFEYSNAADNNKDKPQKIENVVDEMNSTTVNDSYKSSRSTGATLPIPPKPGSLERTKKIPPPPLQNGKVEFAQAATKTPPSPPPKPKLNNHSLSYQMALNESRTKPYLMMYDRNHPQGYGDYDNMPSLYPLKVPPKRALNTMEISNGPPGYYQSLPQSSYHHHHHHHGYPTSKDHAIHQRYSSHAETISNFINGTTSYNNIK